MLKIVKVISFFASRGNLNDSCFLEDAESHLQRKNSQADEARRMSSPTEHCRALQREKHQQTQQKNLHGLGFWHLTVATHSTLETCH